MPKKQVCDKRKVVSKGKKLPVGTVRQHGDRKEIKTSKGWVALKVPRKIKLRGQAPKKPTKPGEKLRIPATPPQPQRSPKVKPPSKPSKQPKDYPGKREERPKEKPKGKAPDAKARGQNEINNILDKYKDDKFVDIERIKEIIPKQTEGNIELYLVNQGIRPKDANAIFQWKFHTDKIPATPPQPKEETPKKESYDLVESKIKKLGNNRGKVIESIVRDKGVSPNTANEFIKDYLDYKKSKDKDTPKGGKKKEGPSGGAPTNKETKEKKEKSPPKSTGRAEQHQDLLNHAEKVSSKFKGSRVIDETEDGGVGLEMATNSYDKAERARDALEAKFPDLEWDISDGEGPGGRRKEVYGYYPEKKGEKAMELKQQNVMKSLLYHIMKEMINKARGLPIGTVREHGKRKEVKTPRGWVPVKTKPGVVPKVKPQTKPGGPKGVPPKVKPQMKEKPKPRTMKEAMPPKEYKEWVDTGKMSEETASKLVDAGIIQQAAADDYSKKSPGEKKTPLEMSPAELKEELVNSKGFKNYMESEIGREITDKEELENMAEGFARDPDKGLLHDILEAPGGEKAPEEPKLSEKSQQELFNRSDEIVKERYKLQEKLEEADDKNQESKRQSLREQIQDLDDERQDIKDELTYRHQSRKEPGQENVKHYSEKFQMKMRDSLPSTAAGWIDGIGGISDKEKKQIWDNVKGDMDWKSRDRQYEHGDMPKWLEAKKSLSGPVVVSKVIEHLLKGMVKKAQSK